MEHEQRFINEYKQGMLSAVRIGLAETGYNKKGCPILQ